MNFDAGADGRIRFVKAAMQLQRKRAPQRAGSTQRSPPWRPLTFLAVLRHDGIYAQSFAMVRASSHDTTKHALNVAGGSPTAKPRIPTAHRLPPGVALPAANARNRE
jgi:hypothetical protein